MIKFKDTPGELAFRQQIHRLLEGPKGMPTKEWRKAARSWCKAFLAIGSETPDNVACTEHVDYGPLSPTSPQKKQLQGLRIKGSRVPLSTLSNHVEGLDMPKEIIDEFPELTQAQWDAFLRVVTMLFVALEHPRQVASRGTRKRAAAR